MKRRVVLIAVGFVTVLAPTLSAHEEKDPVCGMMVDIDTAKWKTEYTGKTYYFCMEAEIKAFRANPEKYVSMLRLTKVFGPRIMVFSVRPREPRPGEAAKCYLSIAKTAADGMSADETRRFEVRRAIAQIFRLDRTRIPTSRRIRFQPTDEKRLYGLAFLVPEEGEYRLRVETELDGGAVYTAHFDFAAVGEAAKHAHQEQQAPAVSAHQHDESEPRGENLSMEAQHRTMRILGKRWSEVGEKLFAPRPDLDRIRSALEEMDRWQRNMLKFQLHKYPEEKAEFDRYAAQFDEVLSELLRRLKRRDWEGARRDYVEIDGTSCTKCHLKFRWGATEDLSRFPDLRRLEYAREE